MKSYNLLYYFTTLLELAAFDMDKLIKDVKEKISQKFHYIIIEGIMLYEDTWVISSSSISCPRTYFEYF